MTRGLERGRVEWKDIDIIRTIYDAPGRLATSTSHMVWATLNPAGFLRAQGYYLQAEPIRVTVTPNASTEQLPQLAQTNILRFSYDQKLWDEHTSMIAHAMLSISR